MRTLLSKKEKYYKEFSAVVVKQYKQMRYGIATCTPVKNDDLASMRAEIVQWQTNSDDDALSQSNINYTTWLPVNYRNDALVNYDPSKNAWGPGYVQTSNPHGSSSIGMGYTYGNGTQNIIEVNTGGCITRINLNPAITINQNSAFEFIQSTPSTVWVIEHNMGIVPNVTTENLNGDDISGVVEVVNNNSLKIYFNTAVAGKAYLS
jgi:hypothetical protein